MRSIETYTDVCFWTRKYSTLILETFSKKPFCAGQGNSFFFFHQNRRKIFCFCIKLINLCTSNFFTIIVAHTVTLSLRYWNDGNWLVFNCFLFAPSQEWSDLSTNNCVGPSIRLLTKIYKISLDLNNFQIPKHIASKFHLSISLFIHVHLTHTQLIKVTVRLNHLIRWSATQCW